MGIPNIVLPLSGNPKYLNAMAEINEEKLVKEFQVREKIRASISEAYEELREAIRKDRNLDAKTKELVGKNSFSTNHIFLWAGKYWYYLVFIAFTIALVFKLAEPQRKPKRSHHKYDENGKLIY